MKNNKYVMYLIRFAAFICSSIYLFFTENKYLKSLVNSKFFTRLIGFISMASLSCTMVMCLEVYTSLGKKYIPVCIYKLLDSEPNEFSIKAFIIIYAILSILVHARLHLHRNKWVKLFNALQLAWLSIFRHFSSGCDIIYTKIFIFKRIRTKFEKESFLNRLVSENLLKLPKETIDKIINESINLDDVKNNFISEMNIYIESFLAKAADVSMIKIVVPVSTFNFVIEKLFWFGVGFWFAYGFFSTIFCIIEYFKGPVISPISSTGPASILTEAPEASPLLASHPTYLLDPNLPPPPGLDPNLPPPLGLDLDLDLSDLSDSPLPVPAPAHNFGIEEGDFLNSFNYSYRSSSSSSSSSSPISSPRIIEGIVAGSIPAPTTSAVVDNGTLVITTPGALAIENAQMKQTWHDLFLALLLAIKKSNLKKSFEDIDLD